MCGDVRLRADSRYAGSYPETGFEGSVSTERELGQMSSKPTSGHRRRSQRQNATAGLPVTRGNPERLSMIGCEVHFLVTAGLIVKAILQLKLEHRNYYGVTLGGGTLGAGVAYRLMAPMFGFRNRATAFLETLVGPLTLPTRQGSRRSSWI